MIRMLKDAAFSIPLAGAMVAFVSGFALLGVPLRYIGAAALLLIGVVGLAIATDAVRDER